MTRRCGGRISPESGSSSCRRPCPRPARSWPVAKLDVLIYLDLGMDPFTLVSRPCPFGAASGGVVGGIRKPPAFRPSTSSQLRRHGTRGRREPLRRKAGCAFPVRGPFIRARTFPSRRRPPRPMACPMTPSFTFARRPHRNSTRISTWSCGGFYRAPPRPSWFSPPAGRDRRWRWCANASWPRPRGWPPAFM